jgi:hypothetical protein
VVSRRGTAPVERHGKGYDVPGIWNQNMNKSTDIKDLRERIDRMQNSIQPLLKENGAKAALWEEWKYSLVHATWREKGNKGTYYRMRVVSLVSAIIVPALVGLNFAGTGGIVVRWLTFAFSLVAAIATGILTLYRTGDRWLMYRRLMDSLMASGCTLVEGFSTDSQRQQAAWAAFTSANDRAIATYNKTYEAAVIHVAQSGSSQPGPTDGDKETKTTTK